MNGKTAEALWNTGAQVSITCKDWLENNFPGLQVRSIQCLLDCGPELDLSAANGTKIKYIGHVVLCDFACFAISETIKLTQIKMSFVFSYNRKKETIYKFIVN